MPYTHKILASNGVVSASTAYQSYVTLLTVGAGKSVIINRIVMNAIQGGSVDIELRFRVVPSGQTPSDAHIVSVHEGTTNQLSANKLKVLAETPFVLGAGDTLSVVVRGSANTSTTVGITVFGVEIS